jgi:tRNA (guanine26-N2/guanine27-N2)-dimethyltransferase
MATYVAVREGAATVRVPAAEKVSREMEVFYNPAMKLNRDVTVLLLKVVGKQRKKEERDFGGFAIGSPLAGTGVRECRLLVELEKGLIKEIAINDYSKDAVTLIKKNLLLNKKNLNSKDIRVSCGEANRFLLESRGFTYIDLDPFGTPNPFLDAAVKRLQRRGLLGVTATDTAALAGTYPAACRRKYWAEPMRNHLMHEAGLRILVRKVQLVGAQYEKALVPVFSYAKDHYMRVFFLNERRKKAADVILKNHQYLHYCPRCLNVGSSNSNTKICCGGSTRVAGPLWAGQLWDAGLASKIARTNRDWRYGQPENQKLLDTIASEAKAPASLLGFYPLNLVRKTLNRMPKRKEDLLGKKGVWPTHFEGNAVKAEKIKLLF